MSVRASQLAALADALAARAPLDLRVNTLKITRDAAQAQLAADGIETSLTPYSPVGLRAEGKPALQRHPLFTSGAIEVQDEGSQLLCYLAAPKRGELAGLKGKRHGAVDFVDPHLALHVFDPRLRGRIGSAAMTPAVERHSDRDHFAAAEVGRQRSD